MHATCLQLSTNSYNYITILITNIVKIMEIQKPVKAQKYTIPAVGAVLVQEGKLVAAVVAVVGA